jgi:hypothetical protein
MFGENRIRENRKGVEERLRELEREFRESPSPELFLGLSNEYLKYNKDVQVDKLFDDYGDVLGLTPHEIDLRSVDPSTFKMWSSEAQHELCSLENRFDFSVSLSRGELDDFVRENPNIAVQLTSSVSWDELQQIPKRLRTNIKGVSFKSVDIDSFDNEEIAQFRNVSFDREILGPREWEALLESNHISGWRQVRFWHNFLPEGGGERLAKSPQISGWRRVDLGFCGLGDDGAKALADSEYVAGWTKASLIANELGVEGKKAINDSLYTKNGEWEV